MPSALEPRSNSQRHVVCVSETFSRTGLAGSRKTERNRLAKADWWFNFVAAG